MYLLLRNNKQSGPYSLEELKSMGLKAYDLVWLEGKSAAWRYPCEVDELKNFAPPVDEQPFDRFYKKPSAVSATASTNAAGATLTAKPVESSVPVTVESTRTPGKRIIYVTMPAGKSPATTATLREPARESAPPLRETALPPREPIQPLREPLHPMHETVPPLYEPIHPSGEHRQKARVVRFLAIGFSILALLAAGIFIGLSLNRETLPFSSHVVAKVPPTTPDPAIVHPAVQNLPVPASVTPVTTNHQTRSADSAVAMNSQPAISPAENAKPANSTKTTARKDRWTRDKQARSLNQANAVLKKDAASAGSLRDAVHRADVEPDHHDNVELPDRENIKLALASQVSVGANGYSVGTFGGISGLQLTVTNRSVYPIDLVVVEVQYVQANKKIYKTENMFFRGIGAGSALMQEAPRSSRGVKVQYKITNISSKDIGLTYSGI